MSAKPLSLAIPIALFLTSAAMAATVSSSVSPGTQGDAATLNVTGSGYAAATTLPTALTVNLPSGVATGEKRGVANSRSQLCTSIEESDIDCPPATQIGTGSLSVSIQGISVPVPITYTFFLGKPRRHGCPATVALRARVEDTSNPTETTFAGETPEQGATGDLCPHGGGLQVSIPNLPTYSDIIPSGITSTVNSISLSLGASFRGSPLIRNPKTCPRTKHWTGSFALAFGGAASPQPFRLACRR